MKFWLRSALACVLSWAFVCPALSQGAKAGLTEADVVGSYDYSSQWGGTTLTFAPGGKYSSLGGGCTHESLLEGTYRLDGGRVLVRTSSGKQWPHGRRDSAEDIELPEGESWGDREQRLLPVRWGARLYLLGENELLQFCNAVNAGVEPRGGEGDADYSPFLLGAYFGSFYLRVGDEKKKAEGEPQMPEEWSRFILKKPVEGVVLSVGGGEGEAVLNVGARHGLRKGMLLFLESDGRDLPPSNYNGMEVLSVAEETAVVRGIERAKVGDKVSTRFTVPEELR